MAIEVQILYTYRIISDIIIINKNTEAIIVWAYFQNFFLHPRITVMDIGNSIPSSFNIANFGSTHHINVE